VAKSGRMPGIPMKDMAGKWTDKKTLLFAIFSTLVFLLTILLYMFYSCLELSILHIFLISKFDQYLRTNANITTSGLDS
jgi:hypothetical protein